jgi:hypothetical protein
LLTQSSSSESPGLLSMIENIAYHVHPCDWEGIGSRRIEIISIGSDRVFLGFLSVGFRRGFCRIRSVFYEKCRIPMKSNTDPIENDRICRSDWLSWTFSNLKKDIYFFKYIVKLLLDSENHFGGTNKDLVKKSELQI